jgi:CO/xanthine dehydrogenase Mo-binding subunit
MSEPGIVGRSVLRRDLVEKVTGAATYTVDITPTGALHGVVVRSSHAHARIAQIDFDAALKLPGVVAVVTAEQLAGVFPRFGHIIPDHFILASEKVRYYGEPVALVVGTSVTAASDGARAVDVRYDELPAVMTPEEALAIGAQLVHTENYGDSGDASFAAITDSLEDEERNNCAYDLTIGWGDPDAAFAAATTVIEDEARYPMLYAYAMEPYNAVADYREGRLHVITSAQHPFMVRNDLARVFSLPLARVRVEVPYVGGGYGSKSYTKIEPLAAVGSWVTGRPVKIVLDVEESIYTTRADSARVRVRTAFDADGIILAREFDIVMNSGAYADNSPFVVEKAVNRCFGPYRVPNLRVRGRSVYTNTSPASSYRGFGAPQGSFAGEMNLDHAAQELGIDPAEIRLRNLVDKGEEVIPNKRGLDADLKADLAMVMDSLRRDMRTEPNTGIGIACTASDAGAFPVSTAEVRLQTDGSAVVLSGSTEIGQGSRSALAQIAAEELGLRLDQIDVAQSDTGTGPYERTTGASRTTTLTGLAVQRACADARAKIAAMAAELYGGEPADYPHCPGGVLRPDGTDAGFGTVIRGWFGANAGEVTGLGLVRREGVTKAMPPFWEIGMVGVEVQVDHETGVVDVCQLVTVADVGFAVNPRAVEGQDLGAATQGLGGALYEELVYDGPQLLNPNIVEYRVPRMKDMPAKIDTMLAERRDGIGPYGAKGAGEGALNPMAAAVAAAVARATGCRPSEVPLTPERVWRLINELPPATP